jgi:uncharacterized protein
LMILYSSSAETFRKDVDTSQITDKIRDAVWQRMGYLPAPAEQNAWNNSMQFMERVVRNSQLPDDCGILIEFNFTTTSKRIDFMITSQDEERKDNFVIMPRSFAGWSRISTRCSVRVA